ncbi:hypothetical protein GLAREA_02248 [Glarea lozoyensis ATCC 20868]|uniref:Uncharacterized protein n=1 Tax=Glarea lozoyensis (strain ATCC 20868 / MF5171) TaxID=1116229 RepID=S3D2S5_GLAL2|nr:uncharacterized protein GLAREA_02248 [Glarea lozoyensis ATCC 20868]EPE26336.1 hypothetical protein GLAREA_02248 [Glarea lozoyensis ATCC 20868]
MASSGSYRTTEEPQKVDSARADAEWKANPGLKDLVHGADGGDSKVDRSAKAAPFPKDGDFEDHTASGDGSRGIKGWTGDGKGPLNPDEDMPKNKRNL